jgi:hypothetical protein
MTDEYHDDETALPPKHPAPRPEDALMVYNFGACECGLPGDHMIGLNYYVANPGGLLGAINKDFGGVIASERWMTCSRCRTRWCSTKWWAGGHPDQVDRIASLLAEAELAEYREIDAPLPSWVAEALARQDERREMAEREMDERQRHGDGPNA